MRTRALLNTALVTTAGIALLAGCGTPSTGGEAQEASTVGTLTSSSPTTTAAPASTSATPLAGSGNTSSENTASGNADSGNTGSTETSDTSCKSSELAVAPGPDGGGGGMQKSDATLQFTNTGSRTCTMQGFPGVSFVTGDDGQQVGLPAAREGGVTEAVTLAPGASTTDWLLVTSPDPYPAETCKPVDVKGLRIYPPGETAAMFLPREGRTCSGDVGGPLLTVKSVGGR
ncbi:DUF4232 domain-containing protein [Umezawaea beigongshangensis]|uniref:DUF4232 domain-containing protein n=1 Tax=Umezawaea beigongshangensis TaxID=2780383 RepID=UPI0018F196AD|nr:DUF4232 domain-containing protein [Umezawaea beigongshangensis]